MQPPNSLFKRMDTKLDKISTSKEEPTISKHSGLHIKHQWPIVIKRYV